MAKVLNVHQRELDASPERVGALIDSLACEDDALWPGHSWPQMQFDRPLAIGATGGHGPIRYFVDEYTPGQSVRFRFTGPRGFDGYHGYEVVSTDPRPVVLRQTLRMNTKGTSVLSWPLVYRPLHDALIEDSLATAEMSLQLSPQVQMWSPWVRLLRWALSAGKAVSQTTSACL